LRHPEEAARAALGAASRFLHIIDRTKI
jgi:hypothetical protein